MKKQATSPSSAVARASSDHWFGLSDDIVRRFVDILLVEHRYSIYTCAGYRTDLRALDRWLQQFECCTIVTARDAQLLRYLSYRARRRVGAHKLPRVLLSMRRFYAFLRAGCFRDDDPMQCRSVVAWRERHRPRATTIQRQRESSRAIAERDRAMLALLIAGDFKTEQLIALQLSDLHLDLGYLSVRGEQTAHEVLLSANIAALLSRFLDGARVKLLKGRDSIHVFPSHGGRALTQREFWSAFRRRSDGIRAPLDGVSVVEHAGAWRSGFDWSGPSCHQRA